jgi:glycolate oxidase FAD binding subunit
MDKARDYSSQEWHDRILSRVETVGKVDRVDTPGSIADLQAIVADCASAGTKLAIVGNGSKVDWGKPMAAVSRVVSTVNLAPKIDLAEGDFTVTVSAGTTFADLSAALADVGQWLAIDPTFPELATVGGILSTADTNSFRQGYGGIRDRVLGISFVRADGKVAKAGGQVVKNVAGYDLMKLLTGAYGTLGIIVEVTLRTYPQPQDSQTIVLSGAISALEAVANKILMSSLTPVAFDAISAEFSVDAGGERAPGLCLRYQSIPESNHTQADRTIAMGTAAGLTAKVVTDDAESSWWQDGYRRLWEDSEIVAKVGVRSTAVFEAIAALGGGCRGTIGVKTGLGYVELAGRLAQESAIVTLRDFCRRSGGFLSVIEAPLALKEKIDVWGYSLDSQRLASATKSKFDPLNIFNPDKL